MSTIPQSISGLQVWLDGADPLGTGTAPSNGATVSTWIDKSGNGYNAATVSGKSSGTYTSSNKSIYFANSTTAYVTSYPANPTAETMFVVFNNPSPSFNNNMLIGGQVGARSLGGGYTGAVGTGAVGVLNNEVAWLAATAANSYTSGTTVIVTCNFTLTYNYIALNGGTFSTGGSPGFYSGTTTYLGTDTSNSAYYYIGYEMEILFYNSVLSTANQQKIEGYLAWKWGIQSSLPSGHPYKSAAPTTTPQAPTVPIAIPANTSLLFVNTSSFSKTFTLPAISSNPGRLLIFKDIYGSFFTNSIYLSTTGSDGFENNGSTLTFSTNYGAWTLMNDAMTKWFLIDSYKNTMMVSTISANTGPTYSNFLWTRFYNITSDPSINGPGSSGWGALIGTSGAYNPINYQDGDSRIGQSDYVGVVSKGFMYSATTTVVTFRTNSDDGIVVYFNGATVISNWTYHGDTINDSASVTLPAGYTPIELRFFEWGGGFTCELYWSIGSTGTFVSDGTAVMFYNSTSLS